MQHVFIVFFVEVRIKQAVLWPSYILHVLPDVLLPEGQYLDLFVSESDISGDLSDDELVEVP